jgi:hypothetical protein
MRTTFFVLSGLIPLLLAQAGCSVTPTYQVRVVNESNLTVEAALMNTRNIARQETMARARIGPNSEATLGPAEAAPLDPVELQIGRPEDLGVSSNRHRLRRGNWTATVRGSRADSWEPISVTVEKD